ncbi:hypothetical protein PACILC2_11870 [Paenibacillus cisolokensis]|uniref:Uncharacterized protein n=1 Tax=Paenibacillus cisolokensis TaxID=1658519 RepID=A0ABQ4N339_9BACL|nr:hypothetical protein PACILC2_11870 [Paenibacillus cisolokensis]
MKAKRFSRSREREFWINSKYITYKFEYKGVYTVRFSMQPVDEEEMHIVSEKTIVSK